MLKYLPTKASTTLGQQYAAISTVLSITVFYGIDSVSAMEYFHSLNESH